MGSDDKKSENSDKSNNSDSHNTVLYIQMGACVILIASRYALHLLGEHQAMADVIVGGGILAKPPPFNDLVLFQFPSNGLSLQASSTSMLT